MDNKEAVNSIIDHFDGRDPIADAQERMKQMSNEELRKLVLLASNKIGMAIKGGDYETPLDAAVHLGHGINMIFDSYDSASMNVQATTSETGSC